MPLRSRSSFAWPALLLATTVGCGTPGSNGDGEGETNGGDETSADESSGESGDDAGEDTGPVPDMGMPCIDAMPCDACTCIEGEWSCECPAPLEAEAGFIEIEPVTFLLGAEGNEIELTSSAARIFYSFHPADPDVVDPPVFLLFNGGPAVSSGLLLATNTGPSTITPPYADEPGVAAPNPASWTRAGHVLYFDARAAGFSHLMDADPDITSTRTSGYSTRNFNTYLDGADFVRALLRFLDDRETITAAPVVIVGESYGGTRAGTLLNLLLFHEQYASLGPRRYTDSALVDEILDHLSLAFPDSDLGGPELAAQQFGRQVLIQPLFAGDPQKIASGVVFEQPDSVMDEIDALSPQTYTRCSEQAGPCNPYQNGLDFVQSTGRSIYDWQSPSSWLSDLLDLIEDGLSDVTALDALWAVDPTALDELYPEQRSEVYRSVALDQSPVPGDLEQTFGVLPDYDRHYRVFDTDAFGVFRSATARNKGVDPEDPVHGELFLENLVWVDTFLTNATRDIIIFGPAFPAAIGTYGDVVQDVQVTEDPGLIDVTFAGAWGGMDEPGTKTIRYPLYDASHSVTLDAPEALLQDIEAWLE